MSKSKSPLSIAVAIVEDDVPAREILAGWIRHADGFRLAGEYDDAETAIAKLPPAREILAGWIRHADGFRLAGEYDDAETAIAKLPPAREILAGWIRHADGFR